MRILRLDLAAFGPFTNVALDLCADAEDERAAGPNLAVVYGPNEAGKSSALRAVRAALFGFDARTPDAHKHPYDALRVGMTVAGPHAPRGADRLRFFTGGRGTKTRSRARTEPPCPTTPSPRCWGR